MKNLILLLASIAILPQVDGEIPNSISCTPKQCYTTFEIRASFQTALYMCKKIDGHLMSVRSSASNDAMGELLRDAEGDFWIGLQFNGNGCTDTSRLRRYVWITGDTFTNFTNWSDGDSEPFCAPMCVSVSRDLKWKERSCDKIMDGFLCEHDYTKVCAPLEPRETDESVHYITPFGNEGEGPTMLPMGSVVTGKPSGVRHICTPDGVWLRAPWSCEVLNGGCEHECVTKTPQCTCPAGKALQRNNITCTPNDPCVNLGCEQLCLAGTCLCHDGYELLADGKGCRDKDECRDKMICPNSNCVNTIGSYECLCAAGFVKENGVCVDVDECFSSPCEHECENTKGGYACSCFEGYMPRAGDHTKCELHCDTEVCLATCDINKPTECSCPEGFIKDAPVGEPTVCIDIDECRTNYCSHGCENTLGSYICLCPEGFTLKDGIECDQLSSTPPLITVTPTSNYTKDITSAVTAGGLLGITVCVVLMILIIVFLVHQISRRRSSWNIACMLKSPGEDLQDLQQVTTQKYTKKSSFVNRNVKQDT